MSQPLVSIISPCYNGQKYIEKFLQGVLEQSYRPIELVLVNDGSTDQTDNIIKSYMPLFKEKHINILYLQKENGGQASAINLGLKHITGEYFLWVDSDDYLYSDNIRKKMEFFENNPEYVFAQCGAVCVSCEDGQRLYSYQPILRTPKEYFCDLIFEKRIFFPPGIFVVKTDAFKKIFPDMNIIESPLGQNWQILLPMAFEYQCGCIPEILFDYMVHKDSHSNNKKTYENWQSFFDESEELLVRIIKQMKIEEETEYIKLVNDKYAHLRFRSDVKFGKRQKGKYHFDNLKVKRKEEYIYYILLRLGLSDKIYQRIKK